MTTTHHTATHDALPHGTLRSYVIGFALSILLTLAAFWAVLHTGALVIPAIIALALLQLAVQLIFFLHLGRKSDNGWQLLVFCCALVIVGIVVGGTLWIMTNLQHLHMAAPTTNDIYQGGIVAPQNELH